MHISSELIGQVFVQLAGFLIVLWVVKKFLWRGVLTAIETRRQEIENRLSEIAQHRSQVEQGQKDLQRQLAAIEQTSRQRLQEAVIEGQKIAHEIQDKARRESARVVEKTKQELGIEVAKARIELRDHIVRLATQLAQKALEDQLEPAVQAKMTDRLIERIQSEL